MAPEEHNFIFSSASLFGITPYHGWCTDPTGGEDPVPGCWAGAGMVSATCTSATRSRDRCWSPGTARVVPGAQGGRAKLSLPRPQLPQRGEKPATGMDEASPCLHWNRGQ